MQKAARNVMIVVVIIVLATLCSFAVASADVVIQDSPAPTPALWPTWDGYTAPQ